VPATLPARGLSGPYATRILCETVVCFSLAFCYSVSRCSYIQALSCLFFQDKEERCRDKFERDSMFMKMPRNPIKGDTTARDDAEFVIPFHHSLMLKLEKEKVQHTEPVEHLKITRYVDQRETTFARSSPMVEQVQQRINTIKQPHLQTLRDRRAAMENEQYQFQQLVEYKRAMLEKSSASTLSALPY